VACGRRELRSGRDPVENALYPEEVFSVRDEPMRIAYLDAPAGFSGDMILGALLHVGVSLDALRAELTKLPLPECCFNLTESRLDGILAMRCKLESDERLNDQTIRMIIDMVRESDLITPVKEPTLRICTLLAETAERVYGAAPEKTACAKIGGTAGLIEVICTASGFFLLGVDKVYVCTLPVKVWGGGDSPRAGAPLTAELLKGLRVRLEDNAPAVLTPTGAAIVAAFAQQGPVPPLRLSKIGYGISEHSGSHRPPLVRILVGDSCEPPREESLVVLETNIDDFNPELYDYVMERLFSAGARDVFFSPIHMKKNRPGVLLWVLCDVTDRDKMMALIFTETSTFGVRSYPVTRVALPRENKEVVTSYGTVRVKLAYNPDGRVHVSPEYEDCKRLAREKKVPLKVVYEAAMYRERESRGV
jgi:uncharacterized protein (TIGR00299 family) protein